MKLHVMSDIHGEFGAFEPPPTDADMVVLAGDTRRLIVSAAPYASVLTIPVV